MGRRAADGGVTRNTKPVIASMSDVAASGGYYIACPADVIFALPATLTGSIGVFGGKVVVGRLLDRIGPPDERFTSQQEDLDLCWRARVAGFRVLWTPQAVALHRGATVRGERTGTKVPVGIRYAQERAAVNSMLKNYGVLTLLWILPLSIAQSAVRIVYYAITRRFDDAIQMVAAWGWNIAHLAGTIRRRVRTQSVRAVPDRQIRQFMAPAWFRLSRSARQVVDAVRPLRDEPLDLAGGDDDEGPMEHPSIVGRIGRFAVGHPVAVAWILATFLAAFAYRHLSGDSPLAGGALTSFPSSASGFFGELYSGVRHTGLGGSAPGSPALGMLGLGSVLAFGAPALLQKAMIMILPAAAAVGVYRTVRSLNVDKLASVAQIMEHWENRLVDRPGRPAKPLPQHALG
jgi:hypothetical protein